MEIKDVKPHIYPKDIEEIDKSETKREVTKRNAIIRKKTIGEQLAETIFTKDLSTVRDHLIFEVAVPGVLDFASNMFHDVIDAIFDGYGTRRPNASKSYSSNGVQYVNYNKVSTQNTREVVRPRSAMHQQLDSFIFPSRKDAYDALDDLNGILHDDGKVSIGSLFDIVGIRPKSTDWNYGWTDLRDARIREIHDGYRIILPEPEDIRNVKTR